jgi:hypothetical protein
MEIEMPKSSKKRKAAEVMEIENVNGSKVKGKTSTRKIKVSKHKDVINNH